MLAMLAANNMLAEFAQTPLIHLCLGGLEQLGVLLRVRLLNIALRDLLHHEVPIDDHVLGELAARNAPLARDRQDADRRLSVDEGVDAVGGVGEGELVCCL